MKSVKVILISTALVVSGSAFAFSPKMSPRSLLQKTAKPAGKLVTECTNFSGYWTGVCAFETSDGQSGEISVEWTIVQDDCGGLDIDNEWVGIGDLTAESNVSLRQSAYDVYDWYGSVLKWNEDETVLDVSTVTVSYSHHDSWSTYQGGGSMRIENDQLIYRFAEITGPNLFEMNCTFDQSK